jgi:hypothetical protein
MRLPLVLLALLAFPGCFTGRVAAGPTISSHANPGVDAKGGLGMGWGKNEHGFYFAANVGFTVANDRRAPGILIEGAYDYVSERGARDRDGIPFRAGLRSGVRLTFEGAEMAEDGSGPPPVIAIGGAVALFPWSKYSPDRSETHEKMGRLFPRVDGYRNLGLELGVYRLIDDRNPDAWMFSLAFVADWYTIAD